MDVLSSGNLVVLFYRNLQREKKMLVSFQMDCHVPSA